MQSWLRHCRSASQPGENGQPYAERRTSYTTDAFQFSSARQLALSEDPSQPTVVPLDKSEDVISREPTVEVIRSDSNHVGPE